MYVVNVRVYLNAQYVFKLKQPSQSSLIFSLSYYNSAVNVVRVTTFYKEVKRVGRSFALDAGLSQKYLWRKIQAGNKA